MKKILFIGMFLFLVTVNTFSQISIREEAVVEKAFVKPQLFDSLTNFSVQDRPIDYKKFIGYQLYFLPQSRKFIIPEHDKNTQLEYQRYVLNLFVKSGETLLLKEKMPFEQTAMGQVIGDPNKLKGLQKAKYIQLKKEYENQVEYIKTNIYKAQCYPSASSVTGSRDAFAATPKDSIEGKYFTIIDVEGMYLPYDFEKLDDITDNAELSQLRVYLKDENNDTLYWQVPIRSLYYGTEFFLVPFFEKQRKMYLNQNLMLKREPYGDSPFKRLVDVNTGELIDMKFGEVWTCTDVSFLETNTNHLLTCYYFLRNNEREVKIELREREDLIKKNFMFESDYLEKERLKQLHEEERIREEQAYIQQKAQEREQYRQNCINKWGAKMGTYIFEGKVSIGMTKEMCEAAWGLPNEINITQTMELIHEQWVYGYRYLYFDNGILTAIQY